MQGWVDQDSVMKMDFEDLLSESNHLGAPAQQAFVRKALAERAGDFGVCLYQLGDPIPRVERWCLIGVATYSIDELRLLDVLKNDASRNLGFSIFLLDDCLSVEEIRRFIPGVGKVLQSPLLGIWSDGDLVGWLEGAQARQYLLNS
jgi:hypothetical protein